MKGGASFVILSDTLLFFIGLIEALGIGDVGRFFVPVGWDAATDDELVVVVDQ